MEVKSLATKKFHAFLLKKMGTKWPYSNLTYLLNSINGDTLLGEKSWESRIKFLREMEFEYELVRTFTPFCFAKNNIRVGVLLINDHKLYTLEGKLVNFDPLGRSNVWIDKNLLGKIDIK